MNIVDILERVKKEDISLLEAMQDEEHLQMKLLNVDEFVKKNNIREISDPILFLKDGVPSPEGLLSNEIFGITKVERSNIYAYIDLGDTFMHPLCYKIWSRMDSKIRDIIHGTKTFSVNEYGDLVEDPNGSNGVNFIKKNIDKIKIKSTGKYKRDQKIKFLEKNKKIMFMTKVIVIPAYYRDANITRGNMSVGQLNKYYQSLLISVRSLKETQDFGLSLSEAVKGRIQETILDIYNCLCGTSHNKDDGTGLSGKLGLVKGTIMGKTTDYGNRLVLSAPDLKVERLEDLMVDIDHCALPLAAALVNFYPFIIFYVKQFFQNQFTAGIATTFVDINSKQIEYVMVKDPLIVFSDEVIKTQLKRFIHGFSNRFIPIEVPLENGQTVYMTFKGRNVTDKDFATGNITGESSLINRRLTWCDIFYMAAEDAVRDKHVLITRYPIDSAYNQFPNKIRISTIKETEKVYVNNIYYRFYPRIREEDIGSNTSHKFIDTLMICNLYLKGMGGDYDGDQASAKAAWTVEANEELDKFLNSKANFINASGLNIKVSTNEAIQSLYSMTKILPQDQKKITDPIF